MPLHVEWTDEELPQVRELLNRAMNCWNPKEIPKWAWELDARVVARMNDLKQNALSKESP